MNPYDSVFDLPLYPPRPHFQHGINQTAKKLSAETLQRIMDFSFKDAQQKLTTDSEDVWMDRGQKRALALFHAASQHVPAYKDFLKKNGIRPSSIKTFSDFQQVPLIDKENYLRAYSLQDLAWYGDISTAQMISVSSGSSGQPCFWPRGQILDAETALVHELFLETFFSISTTRTLFVNCFSMGMYVAGPITLNSILRLGQKGYPITVVTPGIEMEDTFRLIPELFGEFEQVIFAGYPPFIKDILDRGIKEGISWKEVPLRFILAGEGFTETWREYVAHLVGHEKLVENFINLYGSADAAVLAHETPTSIVCRRRVAHDMQAREALFGACDQLPSFLQYFPEQKYFEEIDDELVFTATGGIPLVRYNIHDSGGVLSQDEILRTVPSLREYFNTLKSSGKFWNLPFVYVFGKSDATVTLYGLNIYIDNIRAAIEQPQLRKNLSGRFSMSMESKKNQDRYLLVNVELLSGIEPTTKLRREIRDVLIQTLMVVNAEYRKLVSSIGAKAYPVVKVYKNGESKYFTRMGKQAWINKKKPR